MLTVGAVLQNISVMVQALSDLFSCMHQMQWKIEL